MYTLRTYDLTSASRKLSVNNMAERMEIQWLDGQANVPGSVEKICPKRHIKQNQWQSEWNEMYLKHYEYISDYECIFNHPVSPYTSLEDPTRWDALQQLKQKGTEIFIKDLAHFTSPDSAKAIIECEGFRGGEKKINEDAQGDIIAKFCWWSPLFTEQDIQQVQRNLGDALRPFFDPGLQKDSSTLTNQFATSDAFMPNSQRYGSSYFKYNINELCDDYGSDFNGEVQFKILGTFGYKKEVMHAVLVCSEANASGMFRSYPEIGNRPDDVVVKHGPQWIWKPQATGTAISRLDKYLQPYWPVYRRWEHVAFAFHIPDEWGDDPSNEKLMVVPELGTHLRQLNT